MKKLTKLPRTQFSGLEYSNLITDIQQLITESPEYNTNWDNFTDSNIGRIMIELFSWIADQLATRIDWVANENFISTATQKKSIIKLLSLIGYELFLPKSAKVDLTFTADSFFTGNEEYIRLTDKFNIDTYSSYKPFLVSGRDKDGGSKSFEALMYDDVNQRFLYNEVSIYNDPMGKNSLSQNISFYEGSTKIESFEITSVDNQKFSLTYGPIINNSIAVFRKNQNTGIQEELLLVSSFLASDAQRLESLVNGVTVKNAIPYIIKTTETNSLTIEFAPISIISSEDRRPSMGDVIYVVYRVGGGVLGNISPMSINTSLNFTTNLGNNVRFLLTNTGSGVGGVDSESIESALYNGPLSLRTAQKTVTKEDYEILLGFYTNMIKAKSYGLTNIPSTYYSKYKMYLNPYEVWNFVCLKKAGWDLLSTEDYNLFNWVDLKLENRFNEAISFGDGKFNEEINILNNTVTRTAQITANTSLETFKNFVVLSPSDYFSANLLNGTTLSELYKVIPFKQSTTQSYFNTLTDISMLSSWYLTPNAESKNFISTSADISETNYSIVEDCNAEIFGDVSISTFVPTAIKKVFDISIDGRKTVQIELEEGTNYALTQSLPTLGITDTINSLVSLSYHGLDIDSNLNPYAFGYHNIGIVKGGVGITNLVDIAEIGSKLTATYLKNLHGGTGINVDELVYLRIKTKTNSTVTTNTYSFTLNDDVPTSETVAIHFTSSTLLDYSGKYFVLYDKYTPYFVWFDTTGADTKPTDGNTYTNSIKVDISADLSVDGIGTTTASALTTAQFSGSFNTTSDILTVTIIKEGICYPALTGNLQSGTPVADSFTPDQLGKGEGAVEYPIVGDFNINSFEDVVKILNRRLQFTFELGVEVTLVQYTEDAEEVMGTCYDIRFQPLSTSNILGVEVLKDVSGHLTNDIVYLLTEGRVDLTRSRPYGIYTNVASVTIKTINGVTSKYLKLTSPNTGKDSEINIGPVDDDTVFSALTGMDHEVVVGVRQNIICSGYRKLRFVTYLSSEYFGKFLLELNTPKIPSYYDKNLVYLNYTTNSKDKVALGNTNKYRTASTVSYIYNTELDGRIIDASKTDYVMRFTESTVKTNSLYSINNDFPLSIKKNTKITTVANSDNFLSRVTTYGSGLKYFSFAIDFADEPEATAKTITVDLSSCNGSKEVIELTITSGCSVSGNALIKLRGVTTTIALTNGDNIATVVTKINNGTFTGWTHAIDGTKVVFTAEAVGIKTGNNALTLSLNTMGVVGSFAVTNIGLDSDLTKAYNIIVAGISANSYYFGSVSNYISLNSNGSFTLSSVKDDETSKIRIYYSNSPAVGNDLSTILLFDDFAGGYTNLGITEDYTKTGTYPLTNGNNLTFTSLGDFYITKESNILYLNKISTASIPDDTIYIHYINDRRHELDLNGNPAVIDEDLIKEYLLNYKVLGLENTIKQPIFSPFDIVGKIYCNNIYTIAEIKANIETALKTKYNLENADYGNSISKSDIFKTIQSVVGVQYSEITYLGLDATDTATKVENTLSVDFDEIAILSSDIFDENSTKIHGMIFEYVTI